MHLPQSKRWRIGRDLMLAPHPFDQFVELDRLLGGDQCVGGRKSVFTGGLSRLAGGSGQAGHWRASASTGIGCGGWGVAAQLVSASASSGNAGLIVISGPLIDGGVLRGDAGGGGAIGGAGSIRGGAVIGDGAGKRCLARAVKLLKLVALAASVTGLALLKQE